jgi:hypothetical protein
MGQGEKRLAQMRNNPKGDWKIADVEVVCRTYGIELEKPSGSSHWTIFYRGLGIQTIPVHRVVKPRYIREFVRYVDKVRGANNDC